MDAPRYTIQTAARLSGLTQFVLRAWEKRYAVVHPARTVTNRRLYSDAEVERLTLLRKLTDEGLAISGIAGMNDGELRALLMRIEDDAASKGGNAVDFAGWRTELLRQVQRLDAIALERTLFDAERALPRHSLIEHVLTPFVIEIGSGWREGRIRIVQEHLATSVLRRVLVALLNADIHPDGAARAVSATPSGQVHELGVLLAALALSTEGVPVTHLGTDLPAAEIASAARELGASLILLSVVYPPDDPLTFSELVELVRLLPTGSRLLVGGSSAPAYLARIDHPSVHLIENIDELATLSNFR